jgi:hypothetical protein
MDEKLMHASRSSAAKRLLAISRFTMGRPIRRHARTDMAASPTRDGVAYPPDRCLVGQMTEIDDCAVITVAGIAVDQQVATALRPHMAQGYRSKLPSSRSRHDSFIPHFLSIICLLSGYLREEPGAHAIPECETYH